MGRGISGFIIPHDYPLVGTEIKMNSDGQHIVATNNCLWLTNLRPAHDKNYIIPSKKYHGNEAYYPHYDNCDAINCSRTRDIPVDYDGLIGVPISYLHKHNPNLFEIIRFRKGDDGKDLKIGGKDTYFRILIRKRS